MNYLKTEKKILSEIKNVLKKNPEKDERFLSNSILSSKRIFVFGQGRSGLVAKSFAMRLMQVGLESYVVGETITPSITKDDLLVLISGSGKTKTVISISTQAKKVGAKIIGITSQKDSQLSKKCNKLIILKSKSKTKGKSIEPLGTLFEQSAFVFLDAIVLGLMKKIGVSEEKMRQRHASLE